MGDRIRHRRTRTPEEAHEKAEREGALMVALAYGGIVALLLALKLVVFP